MTTRTTRTLSIATACILVLVAIAGSASALTHNIFSATVPELGDSCTVDEDTPECEYECFTGQSLVVSANRGSDSRVSISTSCGGETAECSSPLPSCSDRSGPVAAPSTGTCRLEDGVNGSCASGFTALVDIGP